METVAMISGGKDSLCALGAAAALGFNVVAVAHVAASREGTAEVDSYMYQSVAPAAVVAAIARCLALPLYVQELRGAPLAVDTLSYDAAVAGDEVEDLFELLTKVKKEHPSVKYVCTGAIQSQYQRRRVENVCKRLELISLAPLWGFSQRRLLDWMTEEADELDVKIVKVAAMGLGEEDVTLSLKALRPKLLRLADRYGLQCCGEGGEFESLTLDCPMFHTEKISVAKWRSVLHQADDFAPVYFAVPASPVQVVPKHRSRRAHPFAPFEHVVNGNFFAYSVLGCLPGESEFLWLHETLGEEHEHTYSRSEEISDPAEKLRAIKPKKEPGRVERVGSASSSNGNANERAEESGQDAPTLHLKMGGDVPGTKALPKAPPPLCEIFLPHFLAPSQSISVHRQLREAAFPAPPIVYGVFPWGAAPPWPGLSLLLALFELRNAALDAGATLAAVRKLRVSLPQSATGRCEAAAAVVRRAFALNGGREREPECVRRRVLTREEFGWAHHFQKMHSLDDVGFPSASPPATPPATVPAEDAGKGGNHCRDDTSPSACPDSCEICDPEVVVQVQTDATVVTVQVLRFGEPTHAE